MEKDFYTRGCRSNGKAGYAGDMEYRTPRKRYDSYIPTGKPPPITLPNISILEPKEWEKDDG